MDSDYYYTKNKYDPRQTDKEAGRSVKPLSYGSAESVTQAGD